MTDANYTPEFEPADVDGDYGSTGGDITVPTFHDIKPFRFWCQKALPLVYDDSLSYYEVLCKVVSYLNNMMTDLTTGTGAITQFANQFVINQQFLNDMAEQLGQNTEELEDYINDRMGDFTDAYNDLQDYVNQYFNNLDVQDEIDVKLDEMAEGGQFNVLFDPVIQAWMEDETEYINTSITNQNGTLAQQNGRISVLEGRMDTFASLPSGSTSGNAELLDIRTNFLGETFGTAGDAVRTSDLVASGYTPLAITSYMYEGQPTGVGWFDVTKYKGGRIAFIANIAYNSIIWSQYNGLLLKVSDTNTSVYDGHTMSPDDEDTYYYENFIEEFYEKPLAVYRHQEGTEMYDSSRVLCIFKLKENFPYKYLGVNFSNESDITTPLVPIIRPDLISYGTYWLETAIDPTLSVSGEAADAKATGDAVDELNERLETNLIAEMQNAIAENDSIEDVYTSEMTVPLKYYSTMKRGSATGGTISTSTTRCYCVMPLQKNGEKIYFDSSKYNINVAFYRNNTYASQSGWQTTSPYTYVNVSQDCDYVIVTVRASNDTDVVDINDATKTTYYQKSLIGNGKDIQTAFVSASGNDTNVGDKDHPFRTVNKALESGAEKILIASGDYRQQIDLSKSKTGRLELLKADTTGRVYFRPSNTTLATTETKVDGYTKVYETNISATLESNNKWLFIRNVKDPFTVIPNSERLPQQRGYANRLQNTVIRKCSSETLNDALNEIDQSDEYLWYLNGTTLYFSRPYEVGSSTPLSFSDGTKLFINGSNKNTVIMTGIDAEFMAINIEYTVDSVITDCSASYVYGDGGFVYDYALNATFIRCEAAAVFKGTIGDGFNAHGQTGGSALAHKTTGRLIDCWSHDNNDDGFSDHECCESEVYGGLYEYNGKAGITPSYGSHCVCNNVISRENYNGFYVTGAASSAEAGYYTQLLCFGCLAENNNRGNSNHAGYVTESNNNRMILVGCKSISNHIGYYYTSGTLMQIVDCTSLLDDVVKTGGGTVTIQNGSTVA